MLSTANLNKVCTYLTLKMNDAWRNVDLSWKAITALNSLKYLCYSFCVFELSLI